MQVVGANPEPIIHQCICKSHSEKDFLFELKNNIFKVICANCHDLFVGLNKDKILNSWNFKTGEKLQ